MSPHNQELGRAEMNPQPYVMIIHGPRVARDFDHAERQLFVEPRRAASPLQQLSYTRRYRVPSLKFRHPDPCKEVDVILKARIVEPAVTPAVRGMFELRV